MTSGLRELAKHHNKKYDPIWLNCNWCKTSTKQPFPNYYKSCPTCKSPVRKYIPLENWSK